MNPFFAELRRRQVFRAIAAYAAICWLVIEIASVVVPTMDWSPAIVRYLLYAALAGFPICLLAAWYLDLSPEGLRLEGDAERQTQDTGPRSGQSSRGFYGFIAGLLVASVSLALYSGMTRTEATVSLAEVQLLARDGRFLEAYEAAMRLPETDRESAALEELWPLISDRLSLTSDPPGARVTGVYLDAGNPAPEVIEFGETPLRDFRVARHDLLLTLEAEGYLARELLVSGRFSRQEIGFGNPVDLAFDVSLQPLGEADDQQTVTVPGGSYLMVSSDIPPNQSAELDDFQIDRFEVSNADFLRFVQDGGYQEDAHWQSEARARSELRATFTDRTGLPGPRFWSGQQPPLEASTHPVVGVSWYEADAYCRWAGKSLPSAFQWEKASRDGTFTRFAGFAMPWGLATVGETMDDRANFSSSGLLPVDSLPFGQSPYGLYHTAGNAKEWLLNPAGDGRVVSGGSWRDPAYLYSEFGALAPGAANDAIGFRCASTDRSDGTRSLTVEIATPRYEPVGPEAHASLLGHYRYDPGVATGEVVDSVTTSDWIRQEIRYPGPTGERVTAYLWLPVRGREPFQTLIVVPHGGAFYGMTNVEMVERRFAPLIRDGRAAFSVVMKGMTGREWGPGYAPPATGSVRFRDDMVLHATELRLGIDYLVRREDIDAERLAYTAISWGAGSRLPFAAVDDRFAAVVLIGGGIDERVKPTLPEADNVNFAPYIRAPLIMVNGLMDEEHPWQSRGLPLWELLSEPKELVLLEGEGHIPGAEYLIPSVKRFLDETLGPP